MDQKEIRDYSLADSDMLDDADTKHALFVQDAPDFKKFDSVTFTDSYAANFLNEINVARVITRDTVVVAEGAKETADVSQQITDCTNYFKELKYFIEHAFPENRAVWNQFGYDKLNKARYSAPKMLEFMDSLYQTVGKYREQLTKAGYLNEKIELAKTLADQLRGERTEQQGFIKGRPVLTRERINNLNQVWARLSEISKASKIIYKDQPAKVKQYQLPEGSAGTGPTDSTPGAPQA